jgi:hypothetical protein
MPGPFVQAPTALVGRQSQFDTINRLMADLLDGLAQSQS